MLGDPPGIVGSLIQPCQLRVPPGPDRHHLAELVAPVLGCGKPFGQVRLRAPGPVHICQRLFQGPVGCVPVGLLGGQPCGVGWSEVGAVTAERADPLGAGILDRLSYEVGDVRVPAAGHPDVGPRGAGVLTQEQVSDPGGFALRAVAGGRVGELDLLADIGRRQHRPLPFAAGERGGSIIGDSGQGPRVAVGHLQGSVVTAGRDPVTDPDPLPCLGRERRCVLDPPGRHEAVTDGTVQARDLLTRVSDDQYLVLAVDDAAGCQDGQRLGAFGLRGVDADLVAGQQGVEDPTRSPTPTSSSGLPT